MVETPQDSQDYNWIDIQSEDLLLATSEMIDPELMLNLSPPSDRVFQELQSQPETKFSNQCEFTLQQVVYHQQQPPIPKHFDRLPSIDSFDSEWEFDIGLKSDTAGKTSWMFSNKLYKVFVKINTSLNVYPEFNRDFDPTQSLFIRAMVVFSSSNELADPVPKCPNHRDQSARERIEKPEHILRCENEATEYFGVETGKLFKDRLALLVPMSSIAPGEPLRLQFSCQNSCSGMNRKMTSIVFTLENERCEILGRKTLNFKVCSCPKRDKEKDEESAGNKPLPKKRRLEQTPPSTSKKVLIPVVVKQEVPEPMITDQNLATVPSDLQSINSAGLLELTQQGCDVHVKMPNQELKKQLLRNAYDLVAGQMARTGDASCQRYLGDIQKQIDDI